jgi:hypothetical protein
MLSMNKRRLFYFISALAIIAIGLASRRFGARLPSFVAAYAGDTLWAMMVFLGVSGVCPNARPMSRGIIALAFAFGIELSQLFHSQWLDAIRKTRLGGLVLGFGFLWSDLVCYTVGVGVGVAFDRFISSWRTAVTPRRERP